MSHRVAAEVVGGGEVRGVGLVGDDADGARFRACAVEGALRALQHFDARDVVDVNVDGAVDGRDRLLVQIGADGRLRGRVVAVLPAHHAAHVHVRGADAGTALAEALHRRHPGEVFDVVVDVLDVELLELLGGECLDADRHVLQILGALLCRYHDLLETAARSRAARGAARLLRVSRRRRGQHDRNARADESAAHGLAHQHASSATRHGSPPEVIMLRALYRHGLRQAVTHYYRITSPAARPDKRECTSPRANFSGSSQGQGS